MNLRIKGGRSCFYQWDSGQTVIVEHEGTIHEVHFAHKDDERSLTVITKEIENGVEANVPNILLQSSEDIFAYLVFRDEDGTETRKAVRIPVISRPKPEAYVYTETEVLNYGYLDERLKELEGEGLAQAVADYLKENPIEAGATAEEAAQIAQNKQDIENLSDLKLDASKLPEAVNDALAQAKASGEFDGKDGYTPQKGIDYFDGMPGDPGKTPEKGKDYFTDADKLEIAEQAAQLVEIPEGNTAELFFAVYGETTYAEVTEALDDGKMVYVKYDTSLVPYVGTSGNHYFQFINNYGFAVKITLYRDNKWNSNSKEYLTSSSLSNYYNKNQVDDLLEGLDTGGSNQPLTFTGAVNATYDGSEAVSVEIPVGGGGDSADWELIGEAISDGTSPVGGIYVPVNFAEYKEIFVTAHTVAKVFCRLILSKSTNWYDGTFVNSNGTNVANGAVIGAGDAAVQALLLQTYIKNIAGELFSFSGWNSGYSGNVGTSYRYMTPVASPRVNTLAEKNAYVRMDTNNSSDNPSVPEGNWIKVYGRK